MSTAPGLGPNELRKKYLALSAFLGDLGLGFLQLSWRRTINIFT